MQEPPAESAPHGEGREARQMPGEGVSLVSIAWLRRGPKGMFGGSDQGQLIGREGRVSFTTGRATVFEADRHEIRANWPWWEFGAGMHLTVSGKTYRLSFIQPVEDENAHLGSIPAARAAGKAWKAYFGPEKIN
jgi:hypothetical protein